MRTVTLVCLLFGCLSLVSSFVAPSTPRRVLVAPLAERQWNFNDGQAPWGLKKNAEIWNGRVAQMAFVAVFLQELIQGKGVIQGIQEGDAVNFVFAGLFALTLVGLTGIFAIKGDSSYVDRGLADKDWLSK